MSGRVMMPEIPDRVTHMVEAAEGKLGEVFRRIEVIEAENTRKVLYAFQRHRISSRHFAATTGYGYDDIGRDALSDVMADLMGTETALVRPQIASGTHALALCLYGLLRPGDALVSAVGKPYDTLEQVIGPGDGSLHDFGVSYRQAELVDGRMDINGILKQMDARTRVVLIQRSRGYDWRPSLSIEEIEQAVYAIHTGFPNAIVMVDNCYGEFTGLREPGDVGADVMAGSLIKNPGGGLAPTGGYIAGRRELIDRIANRLTSPGIGSEVGSYAAGYQPFFQGLFLAPHVVAQAVKVAALAARTFESMGFTVHPGAEDARHDIIQAIKFRSAEQLIAFVQAIQMCSPVDSEAVPEPWDMPGYRHPVIMAAGTFISGASIELSADAPIRPPYVAYLQGSLSYAHGRLGVMGATALMMERGLV